jgi:hypothetical protein
VWEECLPLARCLKLSVDPYLPPSPGGHVYYAVVLAGGEVAL